MPHFVISWTHVGLPYAPFRTILVEADSAGSTAVWSCARESKDKNQDDKIQYDEIQYDEIQYNEIQYNEIQ